MPAIALTPVMVLKLYIFFDDCYIRYQCMPLRIFYEKVPYGLLKTHMKKN